MALLKRISQIGLGALAGGALGAFVSAKTAPEDPTSKRFQIRQYFRDANRAGEEAKAIKQAELISRFRQDVEDYDALQDEIDHSVTGADAAIARTVATRSIASMNGSGS